MRIARISAGALLIVVSLASLLRFQPILELFSFLSPDGNITALMQLSLRLCLISLGAVGLCLILFPALSKLAVSINAALMKPGRGKFLWYALGTAALLRTAVVLFVPLNLWADYRFYDELGWQWALKGGYYNGDHLTAYWPPAYPFVLSRLYLLFGHVQYLGGVLNIPLGTGIVVFTYLIVRRCWDESVARWTTLIVALFPSQIFFTYLPASEILFTFLLLASILSFLTLDRKLTGKWYQVLLGGILLGLATLTRVISKLLLVVIIPFWLWETKDLSRTIKYGLVALCGFGLVIVPWMVRNYQAVGVAKINTNTGINLFIGNQPGSGMGYNSNIATQYDMNSPGQEADIDSASWHRALDYIYERPGAFLLRGLAKTAFFYAGDTDPLQFDLQIAAEESRFNYAVAWSVLAQSYYIVVLVAALLGLIIFFRSGPAIRHPRGYLLLGIILYWTAVHFVFYGVGRYHFPIIPIISAFAALYIKSVVDKRIKMY
ncbi:MAG: glycosyltransferase family 39 protein [Candidatus Zixiibacteriota bacterium]